MSLRFEHFVKFVAVVLFGAMSASIAHADTTNFGGWPERFKGRGDLVPPQCQIDIPTTSTEPFFVKWNCTDDHSPATDIRTELWIYRNGAPAGELLGTFLGFPASIFVDQGVLKAAKFTDGLPAGFKLLARDRAGNATTSPLLSVRAQDNGLSLCSLTMHSDGTTSTGATTGTPAEDVQVDNAAVTVTQTSTTQLTVATGGTTIGTPCEIDTVCFNNSQLTFSSTLTLGTGANAGMANGTVSIIPGSLVVNVSGTATLDNTLLEDVNVTGTTMIDSQSVTVTLSCSR